MAVIREVGDGRVLLIAGGGKIFTDIAARFVSSERPLIEIVSSPYNIKILKNILERKHLAATEFDYFIFGVEGYSRVTEVQLVRKRIASYLIKSGRVEKEGKRSFDVVVPREIMDFSVEYPLTTVDRKEVVVKIDGFDLLGMTEAWYEQGRKLGRKEEDLRYMKPQATEFKALIGMNAHALIDWFKIRCCQNAQREIRDMANKMLKLCKESAPDLFYDAGANCVSLGYCPEDEGQNEICKARKVPIHKEVLGMIEAYKR